MENTQLLEVKGLKVGFIKGKTELKAVRGVDFSLDNGDILGIVGESGSGKSVTMKSIIGILPKNANITSEKLEFAQKDLSKLSNKEKISVRGTGMSMIFQDPMTALNPLRTIGFHLEEVIKRHRTQDKNEIQRLAIEYLAKVGIPSPETRLGQYPHEFSGGMRQRVLIAMSLCCEPRLLIADEPTTALDVTIQAQILELLKELQKEEGMSIILITHDLGVVSQMCRRIIVMYGGLIMEEALVDDIFYNPKHPYTMALLKSIPNPDTTTKERLNPIPGNAPSISSDPVGCPFAPRCDYVTDQCRTSLPEYTRFSDTHRAMCFNMNQSEGGA